MARYDAPVFLISAAAARAGMHPQTLRQYDRLGLVTPRRSTGRGRRYSQRDIDMLCEIQRLSQEEGVNLAGIKRIMDLAEQNERLSEQVERLLGIVDSGRRVFTASPGGDVVAVPRGTRLRRVATSVSGGALVVWRPPAR